MLGRKAKDYEILDSHSGSLLGEEPRVLRRIAQKLVGATGLPFGSLEGDGVLHFQRPLPKQITESAMIDVIVEPVVELFPDPQDAVNSKD